MVSFYGAGKGPILIDELRCNGQEKDISECKSSPWLSPTNCQHTEDASVECGNDLYALLTRLTQTLALIGDIN